MKTIPAQHLVAAVSFGTLAVVALIFVPDERLAKLVTLVGRVIEDPAGALAALSLLAGAITTLRAAWLRQPPPPSDPSNPFGRPRPWRVPPAPPRPPGPDAASAPDDDDDDSQPPASSDGPPTRPQRRPTIPPGAMALVLALLAGCSPSALRTHQTIATIARVSVVAAHPAIVSACETLMSRCTDDACLERVGHDCEAAAVARDTAHAAVRAYVDTIQIAAHADEGRVAPALDLALSTLARVYDAAREAIARLTGYQLPALPPEALPILRALTAGAVEVLGGGS